MIRIRDRAFQRARSDCLNRRHMEFTWSFVGWQYLFFWMVRGRTHLSNTNKHYSIWIWGLSIMMDFSDKRSPYYSLSFFFFITSLNYCAQLLSCVWLFVVPWTVVHQALLRMEFFRQAYRSGVPFLPLRDLPSSGTEPATLASPELTGGFFATSAPWEILTELLMWLFIEIWFTFLEGTITQTLKVHFFLILFYF